MIEMAITCLALNIYHEARGEDLTGQHAVAQVTMNRAQRRPDLVCRTVFKPYQFSWANPLTTAPSKKERKQLVDKFMPKDRKSWNVAKQIARWTIYGYVPDFTQGANHYHTHAVRPKWADYGKTVATYGAHKFYRLN